MEQKFKTATFLALLAADLDHKTLGTQLHVPLLSFHAILIYTTHSPGQKHKETDPNG